MRSTRPGPVAAAASLLAFAPCFAALSTSQSSQDRSNKLVYSYSKTDVTQKVVMDTESNKVVYSKTDVTQNAVAGSVPKGFLRSGFQSEKASINGYMSNTMSMMKGLFTPPSTGSVVSAGPLADPQCPEVGLRDRAEGFSAINESAMVATVNCQERGYTRLCSYPNIQGFEELENADDLKHAVLNADGPFIRHHVVNDTSSVWLIAYYADWCPHCQHLAPKWLGVGLTLLEADAKVRLAAVDCAVTQDVCNRIHTYPTIEAYFSGTNETVIETLQRFPTASLHPIPEMPKGKSLYNYVDDVPRLMKGLPEAFLNSDAKAKVVRAWMNGSALEQSQRSCPDGREVGAGWPESGWPEEPDTSTRLDDAEYIMAYTLKNWIAPLTEEGKTRSVFWNETDIAPARDWLELLEKNFPRGERQREKLISELRELQEKVNKTTLPLCLSQWQEWVQPLQEHFPQPPSGSTGCTSDTCRVWTLIHTLSLAPGAGHGTAMTAGETSKRIMAFIKNYFGCSECREHAYRQWKKKAYGRVELVHAPKTMPIWFWRLHNAVSVRVATAGDCFADRRWPPIDVCPTCWTKSDSSWKVLDEAKEMFPDVESGASFLTGLPNETAVYKYLMGAYWPSK